MKKTILNLLLMAAFSLNMSAQITETATEAVKNMGLGWNLGNTMDANNASVKDPANDNYWNCQGLESETCWGQPVTDEALIKMMKGAGFGAIRVPVTWYNHMDKDGNVTEEWMARVHEVVDYVIGNGMYCIINVHHDTGADSDSHIHWIKADADNYSANQARYEKLWTQIAEEFKDYDGHLLFEAYNEMLDTKSSWCFASFNTSNKYDATIAESAYEGINSYAQSFVNAVRATGGNNVTRNIIVNTYAAANGYGSWNSHLTDPLTKMQMPEDQTEGHIIFEVHDYPNMTNNGTNRTISDIQKQVDATISGLKTYLPQGAPVIIGEWGTSNVDAGDGKTDYDVRRDLMLQFVDYYVKACKENGIATFYWMGLSDGYYRSMTAFNQPDLAETMAKAYHGDDFEGEYPAVEEMEEVVVFEGDKLISNWSVQTSIAANMFKDMGEGTQVEITYRQETGGDDIQFYYGDWSSKPSFTVEGTTYSGDFNPQGYYGTPVGTEHTTLFSFDDATYEKLCSKGLIVFGDGWSMLRLALVNGTAGISDVTLPANGDDACYNLAGQRISTPQKGIFIKNGRKIIIGNEL